MPLEPGATLLSWPIYGELVRPGEDNFVDKVPFSGVVVLTLSQRSFRAFEEDKKRPQGGGATRGRHVEPVSGEGCGPEVPNGRILRSARRRPGQVRDAAARVDRERVGNGCNWRVRSLSSNVLRSEGQLRRGWDLRSLAQEAWTTRPAQAPRGAIDLRRGTTRLG